jgi:8-oxo-dGTP pyrophosphatase MutT (NUDIX family)
MTYEQRKEQVKSYLGRTVTVKIDRPIGSIHPKHSDIIYSINYGYIPDVLGGDGEELDVYVLGVDMPLDEFTGRIIGIIHRENDVEDKLVAAPEGMTFYQNEIAEAVHFQEQYYNTTVEAIYQKSCGAIVYRKINNEKEYLLLLQNKSQTWSFPKGHMEVGETEEETAIREIFEEIGLTASLISGFRESVKYRIADFINREVILFLCQTNSEPAIRESEIAEYRWVNAERAKTLLYPEYCLMIDKLEEF